MTTPDTYELRTRWEEPSVLPLGRATELHFSPIEGTVLDIASLDSLAWATHDALWSLLVCADGQPRALVLEGLQLIRRGKIHHISPGRCVLPLEGSGRLVVAELREPQRVSMAYGVLILRASSTEVRARGVRAASQTVTLQAVILPRVEDVKPSDLPLEFNRAEGGKVDAYRDLRRLDPPDHPRVQHHVQTYGRLLELLWESGDEAEIATEQAIIKLPEVTRVRATSVLESVRTALLAGPSTSAVRYRLHDNVKHTFANQEDRSDHREASAKLLNALAELRCDQPEARQLAGVRRSSG